RKSRTPPFQKTGRPAARSGTPGCTGTGRGAGSAEIETHQVAFQAEELDLHFAGPGGPPAGNIVGEDQPPALRREIQPHVLAGDRLGRSPAIGEVSDHLGDAVPADRLADGRRAQIAGAVSVV